MLYVLQLCNFYDLNMRFTVTTTLFVPPIDLFFVYIIAFYMLIALKDFFWRKS